MLGFFSTDILLINEAKEQQQPNHSYEQMNVFYEKYIKETQKQREIYRAN